MMIVAMFDLVFLGTAAAAPTADRGSPALLVGRGPSRFLVDCGEGTQRQLLRAGLGFRGLGHVLLTHAHLDHVGGLPGLAATRDDVVESYQVVWHAPAPPELRKARRAHRRR